MELIIVRSIQRLPTAENQLGALPFEHPRSPERRNNQQNHRASPVSDSLSGAMARAETLPRAETLVPPSASAAMTQYRIVRGDGQRDAIAGCLYESYDAAYAVLERYYSDLCCSDDREAYRIEEASGAESRADGKLC